MVKELIIHLGDCKTGSTAIQSCLLDNAYKLSNATICYPPRFNNNPLAWTLSTLPNRSEHRNHREERFKRFGDRLDESDADFGVISAEDFEFVRPEELKEALDEFWPQYENRTRFVSYVRPHTGRLLSGFAEDLKQTGNDGDLLSFFHHRLMGGHFDYAPRFLGWREVFGDAFTLRPFVRDQFFGGDVVKDFLFFVTGDKDLEVGSVAVSNTSLSLRSLMMFKVLHKRLSERAVVQPDRLRWFKQVVGWQMAPHIAANEGQGLEKLRLTTQTAEEVLAVCAADAKSLDETFFGGESVIEKSLEEAPRGGTDSPQSLDPSDHLSAGEIGMIEGWADFLAQIASADIEHFSWAIQPEGSRPKFPPPRPGRNAKKKLKDAAARKEKKPN